MIDVEHYNLPNIPSLIEYSITHHMICSRTISLNPSLLPNIELQGYNDDQWIQIAQPFHMHPIPTRILVKRIPVPKHSSGYVIYDMIMTRTNNPYDWTVNHVLYDEEEESPFPLMTKKRKYDNITM